MTEPLKLIKLRSACAACGHEYGITSQSGPHIKVNCASCRRYCYFAPQNPQAPPRSGRREASVPEQQMIERLAKRIDSGHLNNDFIASVLKQYHENGGLTQKQWDGLRKWDK